MGSVPVSRSRAKTPKSHYIFMLVFDNEVSPFRHCSAPANPYLVGGIYPFSHFIIVVCTILVQHFNATNFALFNWLYHFCPTNIQFVKVKVEYINATSSLCNDKARV